MHPNDVNLDHLRGGWRCTLNQDDYCDLSIMNTQDRFLYDEIRNAERDPGQARIGIPIVKQENATPYLALGVLRLEIFSLEENRTRLSLKYPDKTVKIFRKFTG